MLTQHNQNQIDRNKLEQHMCVGCTHSSLMICSSHKNRAERFLQVFCGKMGNREMGTSDVVFCGLFEPLNQRTTLN